MYSCRNKRLEAGFSGDRHVGGMSRRRFRYEKRGVSGVMDSTTAVSVCYHSTAAFGTGTVQRKKKPTQTGCSRSLAKYQNTYHAITRRATSTHLAVVRIGSGFGIVD